MMPVLILKEANVVLWKVNLQNLKRIQRTHIDNKITILNRAIERGSKLYVASDK